MKCKHQMIIYDTTILTSSVCCSVFVCLRVFLLWLSLSVFASGARLFAVLCLCVCECFCCGCRCRCLLLVLVRSQFFVCVSACVFVVVVVVAILGRSDTPLVCCPISNPLFFIYIFISILAVYWDRGGLFM